MDSAHAHDRKAVVNLEQLPFSDLYIRLDTKATSRYRIGPNRERLTGNLEVPEDFEMQIDMVRGTINKTGREEGTIGHDSMRLRYSIAKVANGEKWAAIRRIPMYVPRIDKLLIDNLAINMMRGWSRSRGIVVIGGATGAGKSTTAAAMMQDFLETEGGTGVTIEDPPEYLLQGAIGENGACFQIEVENESDWEAAGKTAMRWRPRYIMVGEIRSPEAARVALRASTSGHLVITTVHGGSVDETVGAILTLAEAELGGSARGLLADNLVAVIHQRMGSYGPDLSVVQTRSSGKLNEVVGRNIREGRIAQLADHAQTFYAKRPSGR